MFNARGGFSGQRPMGAPRMNQPPLGHQGMNMPNMNMNMNMPNMNQPNMNLSGLNQPGMNPGLNRVGPMGMNPNMGMAPMNQPAMNVNRMGPSGMNQGGMGFQPDLKGQGFNMRPMDNPGPFLGGNSDSMGMKGMPLRAPMHSTPQAIPQHFPPTGPMASGQPRMASQSQEIPSIVNRMLTHSSDHMLGKTNPALQEPPHIMKDKLGAFGNLNPDMGMKPGPMSSLEPMPNTQKRYTSESASSILESFGLSNEDLEELSRYPDDQLTPMNLPNILRDIRLRKVNRTGVTHDQGGGGRRSGGEVVPSKVIDYGHSSKYQINENPSPRSFQSSRTDKKSTISKEPAPSKGNKMENSADNAMDKIIPTISVSRKQTSWQTMKLNRSNNKTLVGEHSVATASDVNISTAESPVITIQPESSLSDIPVNLDSPVVDNSKAKASAPFGAVVGQGGFGLSAEATTTGKGNWGPSETREDSQKAKRLPTPSMMNDYFASSPRIFPHICSLCNVECRHLKDWIKHQNTTTHIENCRKLRQQYPDWNPQVHTLSGTEDKNEETPKRSRSKSGSPRRAKRSESRHRARRSRSRSPKSSGRRSRSRSPRRSRHSPGKSRSPHRGTRSPRHSQSPRRHRRARSNSAPDKRAVDAAVQSFIEASKLKSGEKGRATKPADDGRKPPQKTSSTVKGSNSASPSKNSSGSVQKRSSSSSSHGNHSKKPADGNGNGSVKKSSSGSSNSAARKPSSGNAAKKPTPSSSSSKSPVVSTGAKKTTTSPSFSKKTHAGKPAKSPSTDSCNPLNKFTSKDGPRKIIHVTNLPDDGYTDQDILKIVQPFGKVCDILIVRSRNEAFLETNFKEAATAAVKYSESVPVMINNKRVTLSLAGQNKDKKAESKTSKEEEAKKPSQTAPNKRKGDKPSEPTKENKKSKQDIEIPPGFVKCYRLTDPPLKDSKKCVVLISNLPEKQYSVDEISNLAKPFGGVNDILVISTHRKAYLELASRNSVDSMIKFYDVFPVYLGGCLLKIAVATKYKDVKDENRIFAEILQEVPFKIHPSICESFVHLSNLPKNDFEEFELTRVGLRFGKVEHYMVISNKRKAVLLMSSAGSAKAMHSFLSRYPPTIGDSVIQCSLPTKSKLAEDEYITYLEKENKSSESGKTYKENVALTSDEHKEKPVKKMVTMTPSQAKETTDQKNEDPTTDEAKKKTDHDVVLPPSEVEDQQDGQNVQTDSSKGSEMEVGAPEDLAKLSSWLKKEDVIEEEEEEEAAEAPEAPETPTFDFIQPEPVVQKDNHAVSQVYASDESDILVSVESDEEECEVQVPAFQNLTPASCSLEKVLTARASEEHDSDMEECPNDVPCDLEIETSGDPQTSLSQEPGSEAIEESDFGVEASEVPGSASEPAVSEDPGGSAAVVSSVEMSSPAPTEDCDKEPKAESSSSSSRKASSKHSDEKSKEGRERSKHSSHTRSKNEAGGAGDQTPLTRTAKYNPHKGEISVTLTMASLKSSKTPDSRKRSSGDRGTSGKDGSTPKSSSNRSSPSDNTSSNPKAASYKTNSNNRGAPSQDKDLKVTSRSRERETRSSSRKEDRSKGSNSSSSSRYSRSSKGSSRGPRSKDEEDTFPFNLDEFVTVDEIVEEHRDDDDGDEEWKSQTDGSPKRETKESHSTTSDPKKVKKAQALSFVTLDEVGDDDDNANTAEASHPQEEQSVLTVEVHAKDDRPANAKEPQILVTLDEISDDEDVPTSAKKPPTSVMPEMLSKDQLLTLDEVIEEDEEHTSHSEPPKPESQPQQKGEAKEEKDTSMPEVTENKEPTDAPSETTPQEGPSEKPLLTLDEVKGDDDEEEESIGDVEHKFLTVDEIGEDEEDLEVKEDVQNSQKRSSKSGKTSNKASAKASQPAAKTPAGKRGRPRKRPLPDTPNDSQDVSPQTPSDAEKTPAKGKSSRTGSKGEESVTPNKSEPSDSTSMTETSAKKIKLDAPAPGKPQLGPFNSSVPVGMEFLVPKTGYFCELCSLFYMDDASKLKHCRSLRHYQAVQKHLANEDGTEEVKSPSA